MFYASRGAPCRSCSPPPCGLAGDSLLPREDTRHRLAGFLDRGLRFLGDCFDPGPLQVRQFQNAEESLD